MPPSAPVCRAEKSPRSITVRRGRDLPTTTRRPHASSVHTKSTSEDVSASQTISWAAIGEAGQLAAMIHLSLGCQRRLPSQPGIIRAHYKVVMTTLRMSRTSLKFRDDGGSGPAHIRGGGTGIRPDRRLHAWRQLTGRPRSVIVSAGEGHSSRCRSGRKRSCGLR